MNPAIAAGQRPWNSAPIDGTRPSPDGRSAGPSAAFLLDVRDVRAFAAAAVNRSGLDLGQDEREEMVSEGVVELYRLASQFDGRGRFSGFCAAYLPRRLLHIWHDLHPEHRRITTNGDRRWVYDSPPITLEEAGDPPAPVASSAELTAMVDGIEDGLGERLDAALERIEPWERLGVRRMVELASAGFGPSEIAARMGLDRAGLGALRDRLREALEADEGAPS